VIITKTVLYRGHEIPVSKLSDHSTKKVLVQCPECGEVRETMYSQIIRNGHELCQKCAIRKKLSKSLEVGARYGRLVVLGEAEKAGYSKLKCDCGNECIVRNDWLEKGRTRSCGCLRSDTLKQLWKDKKDRFIHKDEQHPNWQGGKMKGRQKQMSHKEYREWKKAVLERDGHKCLKCGTTEGLCACHKLQYKDYPELRLSVDNGMTLCDACHREFHRLYGKDNTLEQVDEFLKN
jgi:5-methylcytosine-specific restriction endonuclease McrA